MKDVCFVSVAFGFQYLQQLDRLEKSIFKIYPEANTLFYRDVMPPGAKPFLDSLYGFKPHAINEARKKYSKVIWLDPAMILMDKVDDLTTKGKLIAVKDDSVLHNVISDKCYRYYGVTREMVQKNEWHLVGGSLYFFNFENPVTTKVFNSWLLAETCSIFGSQHEAASEQLQGHRYDEAVMALAMYLNGVEPVGADQVRYCCTDNPMFIKKHFK